MLVNKKHFTNLIKKIHLGGLTDEVLIQFTRDKIIIPFYNRTELNAILTFPHNLKEEPFELAIPRVSEFVKFMSLLDDIFEMNIEQDGTARYLTMVDKKYTNKYRITDKSTLVHEHEKIFDFNEPEYDVEIKINQEIISDLLKMKNSVKIEDNTTVKLKSTGEKRLAFILGDFHKSNYDLKFTKLNKNPLEVNAKFNFSKFISIIDNNKDAVTGTIKYKKPFIKVDISSEEVNSVYYLVENI